MIADTAEREAFEKWWEEDGTRFRVGHLRQLAAMLSTAPPPPEQPGYGTCVRCGSAPRNASGLCATCVDEDAARAGEVEDDASQALWRQTLDQERVAPPTTELLASPAPGPAEPVADAPTTEPDFVAGIQGFALMCESAARNGGMRPDDCNTVAAKLRDVAFVVDQLQKLRDGKIACGWELRPALQPAPAPVDKPKWVGWYCPHGQRGVDPREVTFSECHEVCGTYIADAEPPTPVAAQPQPSVPPPASDERVAAMRERCAQTVLDIDSMASTSVIAARIRALPLDGEG